MCSLWWWVTFRSTPFFSPSVPAFPCGMDSQGPIPYLCTRHSFGVHKGGTVSLLSITILEGTHVPWFLWVCMLVCSVWTTAFGIKIKVHYHLHYHGCLRIAHVWSEMIIRSRQCFCIWCGVESWQTSFTTRFIATEKVMMGNLCFPCHSWYFLFSSASHFLGKPAVLISDTHVHRAPRSL